MFTLPADVSATQPRQYVQSLSDSSIATLLPASFDAADQLDVTIADGRLHWLTCAGGIAVATDAVRGAWLCPREHGPNMFASFTLLFGVPDDGVSLLITDAKLTLAAIICRFDPPTDSSWHRRPSNVIPA